MYHTHPAPTALWDLAIELATTPTLAGLLATAMILAAALLLRAWIGIERSPGTDRPGNRPAEAEPERAGAGTARPRRRGSMQKRRLLSDWEAAALPTIAAQCPPGTHVCPQAHVRDFIRETDAVAYRWSDRFRKVAYLVVDFLVVDAAGRPLLVIELDDGTHRHADRALRDRRLDETLREARLPILRVRPNTPIKVAPFLRGA